MEIHSKETNLSKASAQSPDWLHSHAEFLLSLFKVLIKILWPTVPVVLFALLDMKHPPVK